MLGKLHNSGLETASPEGYKNWPKSVAMSVTSSCRSDQIEEPGSARVPLNPTPDPKPHAFCLAHALWAFMSEVEV